MSGLMKIVFGMHVCVSAPRLLITRGMMWHDINSICLIKQVAQLYYGSQRRLWQLGTGQADYSSQSSPKKCIKLLEYTQEGV